MTVDNKTYTLAEAWLKAGGWTNTADVMKLAEILQSDCEDFTMDLMSQYEKECEHEH